jgi:cyanate lyase
MQSYHLATANLQDLLGRMNDLVVATLFTTEGLPVRKAEFICAWLRERNELILQELEKPMADFLELEMPWKY